MQALLKGTGAYKLLKNEGEQDGFSHAYLLLWEDTRNLRDGLKTFAKLFFGCAEPATSAQKRRAELIESENFCDCVFYPAKGKKLVVEDAERILEESNLAPVEGDCKLFVLADFAEANIQTQNKLLKVLEEPPKGVHFLLGASSSFSVLQTVLSRTKKLEILPFPDREIVAFLQRRYGETHSKEELTSCAAMASGNVGDACALLDGGYYQELIDGAFRLLCAPAHQLPAAVKTIGETTHKKELLNLLRMICRDALLLKTNPRAPLLLRAEKQALQTVANAYTAHALLFAQEAISAAEKQVKFNAIFSQCIQVCIANIKEKNHQ